MPTTRVTRYIEASPSAVYRALLDAHAVQQWMVPAGMTSEVHEFDARVGGRFRISLTYDDSATPGKTTGSTDTFGGRFVRLVPDREVVQAIVFEADDPAVGTEMTATYRIEESGTGCTVTGVHENVPESVDPADNELGWRMSLAKLAALVEDSGTDPGDDGRDDPLSDVGA